MSGELAEAKQRAREERRQLSLELASTRTEAAAAAKRADVGSAALADAQGVIEALTARLKRRARAASYTHTSQQTSRSDTKLTETELPQRSVRLRHMCTTERAQNDAHA